jgi:hypothetical protein
LAAVANAPNPALPILKTLVKMAFFRVVTSPDSIIAHSEIFARRFDTTDQHVGFNLTYLPRASLVGSREVTAARGRPQGSYNR